MLAATLGARVVSNPYKEHGFSAVTLNAEGVADCLFNTIPDSCTTFQCHHDSFDLPAGTVLLASSTLCPNQAFRVDICAWGLQFHPEVTEQIIRD